MKKLLLLSALLLALAGRARAQAAPADIVVVRIWESNGVTAIIMRGEGKSEKVEFDTGLTDKNLTRASEGYYKLFAKLYQEGYVLQSTMTTGRDFLTLLFTRKP